MKLTKNQAIVIFGLAVMWVLMCSLAYLGGLGIHQVGHVF